MYLAITNTLFDPSEPFALERINDAYYLSIKHPSPDKSVVQVLALSQRGLLYGASALLRSHLTFAEMSVHWNTIEDFSVRSVPKYAVRGHKIGYNNIGNTWDAWTVQQMESYIRDLIL
jgi:hypothetical protein